MTQLAPTLDTPLAPRSSRDPASRLRGRGLLIERGLWLLLAVCLFVSLLFGILAYQTQLQTACLTDAEHF